MRTTGSRTFKTRAQRRGEIIEAALSCISEGGLGAFTARRIAEATGLSLGQLTYHYASMDEILVDAHREALTRSRAANEAVMAAFEGCPREKLRLLLRQRYLQPVLNTGYVRLRAELWMAALSHPVLAASEKEYLHQHRDYISVLLLEFDGASEPAARAAADVINCLQDGLWLDWLRRFDKAVIEAGIEGCLAIADGMDRLVG